MSNLNKLNILALTVAKATLKTILLNDHKRVTISKIRCVNKVCSDFVFDNEATPNKGVAY